MLPGRRPVGIDPGDRRDGGGPGGEGRPAQARCRTRSARRCPPASRARSSPPRRVRRSPTAGRDAGAPAVGVHRRRVRRRTGRVGAPHRSARPLEPAGPLDPRPPADRRGAARGEREPDLPPALAVRARVALLHRAEHVLSPRRGGDPVLGGVQRRLHRLPLRAAGGDAPVVATSGSRSRPRPTRWPRSRCGTSTRARGRVMVSFGQGCEGEPLLRWKEIERAIRLVRARTRRGSIHANTNGSLPVALAPARARRARLRPDLAQLGVARALRRVLPAAGVRARRRRARDPRREGRRAPTSR